jgi:uncharacterized membrane protein YGL010W
MRTLNDHLSNYAAYHRDRRNIAIHSIGIPLIVLAVATILSRPRLLTDLFPLSPAVVIFGIATAFYLRLDLRFGLGMAGVSAVSVAFGAWAAASSMSVWLSAGLGLFLFGWVLQFIGHYWEGRKPAFVDDIMGLAIGPLFILAEAAFALGLRPEVRRHIESVAGPTRVGKPASGPSSDPLRL